NCSEAAKRSPKEIVIAPADETALDSVLMLMTQLRTFQLGRLNSPISTRTITQNPQLGRVNPAHGLTARSLIIARHHCRIGLTSPHPSTVAANRGPCGFAASTRRLPERRVRRKAAVQAPHDPCQPPARHRAPASSGASSPEKRAALKAAQELTG